MNMQSFIFDIVEKIMGLFADWFSFNQKEWAFCPIRIDDREKR